ncbi:MAG TPA: primosomal protein N' [Gammaproteobacteria bacterium]
MPDQSTMTARILHVAVPTPLNKGFDYLATPDTPVQLQPGCRIRVPFGRNDKIGILIEERQHSTIEPARLKPIKAVVEHTPCLSPELMALGQWASVYYHHPVGEVFNVMLPTLLRQGKPAKQDPVLIWRLSSHGMTLEPSALTRAPRQQAMLNLLRLHPEGLSATQLKEHHGDWRQAVNALQQKGLVECLPAASLESRSRAATPSTGPALNPSQQQAVEAVSRHFDEFKVWLLDGITGSGKTEIYLRLIEQVLAQGKQVLVLVPEIGLTPQLLARFRARLSGKISEVHSGLSDQQRLAIWLNAGQGDAQVIVGTRSAVFMPLSDPGLIIVDEEHDGSLKQQDGFRYHARDLAVWRGQRLNIPVVLGSATPSLESLYNALTGRYGSLILEQRAGGATLPRLAVVDARQTPADQPVTRQLLERMQQHLSQGSQVIIFLNRRGYAPVMMCFDCGWTARCERCDAHMTWHQHDRRLRCHHCGAERRAEQACPDCRAESLHTLGSGTERLEDFLQLRFPHEEIVRIDRDATRRKGELEKSLQKARSGRARILIGTQMLAKGHHFPGVTLVGILGVDHGLFSADFRGPEYMAQLVIQVAGRAGRGERPGEVILETHQPEHPLLQRLIRQSYSAFARAALKEREAARLPPYTKLALIRAEAVSPDSALLFLRKLNDALARSSQGVERWGPAPAPMERRAGRYRAQLLLQAEDRKALHNLLRHVHELARQTPEHRKVRWSVDVDPVEMF